MRLKRAIYRSLTWLGRQETYLVILIMGVAFVLVLLAGLLPIALAEDASAFGRFPAGTRVGGVYVGKLTKAAALVRCREGLSRLAARPFSLKADYDSFPISPGDLGLDINYQKMVDEAYRKAWDVHIVERMVRGLLNKPKRMNIPLSVRYDKQKVRATVAAAMKNINCKSLNPYVDVTDGKVVIVPARDGREAKLEQVLAATNKAIEAGDRSVKVPVVKRTPGKVKSITVGKVILVNLGDHTLSLYDGETLLGKWPVATGSKKWPTCIGEWKVVRAEKNPTWYNRGSAWAENMPWMMPPGPNNPLGTRAITINGGGVLIHGTNDTGSIGYSASHGCVRMRIPDVEALFEHVTIGMPVYIIKQTGEPGFDCSKKPFWKK